MCGDQRTICGSQFSPSTVCSEDQTQVFRLGSEYPHPLSHLFEPPHAFLSFPFSVFQFLIFQFKIFIIVVVYMLCVQVQVYHNTYVWVPVQAHHNTCVCGCRHGCATIHVCVLVQVYHNTWGVGAGTAVPQYMGRCRYGCTTIRVMQMSEDNFVQLVFSSHLYVSPRDQSSLSVSVQVSSPAEPPHSTPTPHHLSFLSKDSILFTCMSVYLHRRMYTKSMSNASRGQKRADSLELELQMIVNIRVERTLAHVRMWL